MKLKLLRVMTVNNQLWNLLKKENIVTGELPAVEEVDSPWYVKVLLAASGWIAAIFLLGFLGAVFSRLYQNTPVLFIFGASLIVVAYILLSRKRLNEFLEHLAFAFSVAGQALLIAAIFNIVKFSENTTIWLIIGLIQVALALVMPNYVHRLVSAFIAATSFATAIYTYQYSSSGLLIYTAFLMLITALLWLNEFKSQKKFDSVRAIAYGFVLGLVVITGTKLFMHTSIWWIRQHNPESEWVQPWMGEVLLSAVAVFVVWKLLDKNQVKLFSTTWILAVIGTLVLTFLSLEAHGLIVAVMIILLGFSASNRVLTGLGVISLLFYISSYYYLLASTLLDKSLTLLMIGVALILGRWLMLKLLSGTPNNMTSNDTGEAQ